MDQLKNVDLYCPLPLLCPPSLPSPPSLPFRLQRMERLKNVRWAQRALPPAVAVNISPQEVEVSPPGRGGPSMPCCMPGVGRLTSVSNSREMMPSAACLCSHHPEGGEGQAKFYGVKASATCLYLRSTRHAVLQGI